jgi:hypothetical protein
MPLVKATLDSSIKAQLEPLIEAKTKVAFEKGLKQFQESLKETKGVDSVNSAIMDAADVFSTEMKKMAADISKVVADNVDIFVKSGTVNVLVTGVTVGAPSPHAITAQPGVGTVS